MAVFVESFIFGAANSLHCTLMCGPLAACVPGAGRGITAYHGARLAGYAALGAVAGTIGATAGSAVSGHRAIPFVLAGLLLLMALGLPARTIGFRGAPGALRRAMSWSRRHGPITRSALLGGLTPLLPCGLLYAAAGTALLTGTPVDGATAMIGFALGTLPAVALAHLPLGWLDRTLRGEHRQTIQRVAMVSAAGWLIWSGLAASTATACH